MLKETAVPAVIYPERLRASLSRALQAVEVAPEALHYQAYYGLDVPHHAKVQRRIGCFRVHDYEIVAQAWWPEQPHGTLLILHGYYDHMGLYRRLVDWGLEMGFAVLGCDLPGHGLSSGPRASINEFGEYQAVLSGLVEQARQLGLPRPWHLVGQSTGGAIAIDHLLHQPNDAELGRSVLLAPLIRPRAWLRSRISYEVVRRFVQQIPRTFTENSSDPAFLDFVQRRDPLQPDILPTSWVGALSRWIPRIEQAPASLHSPLIIQGEADLTVDWRHNLSVLERKFASPEVLRLPDARHHLVNEREALRQQYLQFLRERLK